MLLKVICLLAIPALVSAYIQIHNISDVSYKVKVNLNHDKSTCFFSKFENNGSNPQPLIARAIYLPTYLKYGWDQLLVDTNPDTADDDQAYGAGFCEGVLTCESMINHWTNVAKNYCVNQTEFCDKVNRYLDGNLQWVSEMVEKHHYPFWHQVKLFYKQILGIYYGQKRCGKNSLSKRDIMWLNMLPEIEEMKDAFKMSQMSMKLRGSGRCSAIVKLSPNFTDLMVAHDTWTGYEWMLRQVKQYNLSYHVTDNSSDIIPGRTMALSGYPGTLPSIDDFYVIQSGLVVLETTIGNENKDLWVDPENPTNKVSTLVRAMVANRLARNGSEWTYTYSNYNNGLYNNQWMIVNMKKFVPGSQPKYGTLTVLEQIPSFIWTQDQTSVLNEQGYWPSYNVPSSPIVFNMSGNAESVAKYGDWFSYENNPRAKIFRRDQSKAVDKLSLVALMRSNDYKNDPFSKCNCTPPYSAENAIASRCDLNPDNGTYPFPALSHRSHGSIDVKETSYYLWQSLSFQAICGPTTGTNLPEFRWSTSDFKDTVSHVGQPDVFRFPLATTKWID